VLTAKKIEQLRKTPGLYLDGGDLGRSLYLQVGKWDKEQKRRVAGGASWLVRYELKSATSKTGRRERWLGLGSLADFNLKEAREMARKTRQLLKAGIDPLDQKKADKAAKALAAAKALSFEQASRQYFNQNQNKWSNAKHRAQFLSTLQTYAFPKIGGLLVADIDTGEVLRVLEQDYKGQQLWNAIPETASRLRGRIETVLDWAKVRGSRTGENPARWEGHLEHKLPNRSKIRKVRHMPALPYANVPAFMAALRQREGIAARALEFLVLTAARSGAVVGATRDEIDFESKIWSVPPERAGAKIVVNDDNPKPRRIPLSDRAIQILKALPIEAGNPHLFVGLSRVAMAQLMQEMKFASTTPGKLAVPHGMRSTFKDWVSEETNYPNHVSEAALWHAVADKVEASYRRGDLFEKRRKMMNDWARYCSMPKRDASVADLSAHRKQQARK
jgi:integrase